MQSEHLLEVVVLYVGDAAPCLCKQNSCHDLFLYFSIQAEPRKMLGGAVCGDVLLLSLRSYTHIPQAAPSLCVLLHKHNSVHAGIHWLKHMQKAVLGTASLCFTHEWLLSGIIPHE